MVRAGVISFFQVDGTVSDVLNSRCYDGIDSFFDKDLYTCETDETDKLLEDLGYTFDLPDRKRLCDALTTLVAA